MEVRILCKLKTGLFFSVAEFLEKRKKNASRNQIKFAVARIQKTSLQRLGNYEST